MSLGLTREYIENWVPKPAPSRGGSCLIANLFTTTNKAMVSFASALGEARHESYQQCHNEIERLFLWGHGLSVSNGDLDEMLARSKELQLRTLSLFVRLGTAVLEGLSRHSDSSKLIYEQCDELRILLDNMNAILQGPDAEDDARPSSPSESEMSEYGIVEIVEEISVYIDCLLDLAPSLEKPAFDIQLEDMDELHTGPAETFDVSSEEAMIYCRKIRDRFETLPIYLVQRLAEANVLRAATIRERRTYLATKVEDHIPDNYTESLFSKSTPMTKATDSTAPYSSIFSDTSDPPMSRQQGPSFALVPEEEEEEDNKSEASFASFSTTFSEAAPGRPRVPEMPKDEGDGFDCSICSSRVTNVANRKDWKKHVFNDIKPYVCTIEDCQDTTTLYSHSALWIRHEEAHSVTTSVPCCYFCSATYHDKGDSYYKHVLGHLREISLSVLPQASAEDDDSSAYDTDDIEDDEMKPSSTASDDAMKPNFALLENARQTLMTFRNKSHSESDSHNGSDIPDLETSQFLGLDYEHELVWDLKQKPPQIKGGSLLALTEQLTRHDKLDSNFNSTFLLTYKTFTTGRGLFELLVKRFKIQPPFGLSSEAQFELWTRSKQQAIQFRVINILKSWVGAFWLEDSQEKETTELLQDIENFARQYDGPIAPLSSFGRVLPVIANRMRGIDMPKKVIVTDTQLNRPRPAPIMPKNIKRLKFLDIDPIEFARQMTYIESRLYSKIKPIECLGDRWKRSNGTVNQAPNIQALITHSNQITNWVGDMILTQETVKKRVVVIRHFVSIGDNCRRLNNFSTITSILAALGSAAISRLGKTWDQVPQRVLGTLEEMRQLMNSKNNFAEYEQCLHLANPPCIPFLGVYLTNLTFIENGIPSTIKKTTLINFAKREKTAEIIRDIQQYQTIPYNLQPIPEVIDYILNNIQVAQEIQELQDKSLLVEPHDGRKLPAIDT